MTVTYLYRCPGTGHSIETLFGSVQRAADRQPGVTTRSVQMPYISQGLRSLWKNVRFAASLKTGIVHITGDVHYAALVLPPAQTVLTIHDCMLLKTNRHRPLRYAFFWLFWYYLPIRRAAVVTAVSEATRQALIRYVGSVARKVIVIPDCVAPAFNYQPLPNRTGPPVILQIGTAPHKNLPRLIAALTGIDCRLVIVGPLSKTIIAALQEHQIQYRNYVNLSQKAVIQLYRDCNLVTFVSTDEGFGMPVLEANATGRPVITSDQLPMRAVADGAAQLVDPTDVASIREGILRVLDSALYCQTLIDAGLTNVWRYAAEAIADQYRSCYEQCQSQPPVETVS